MYGNIPLWLSIAFIAGGLAVLAWSSDRFVVGSASLARILGISPFVIGMVIVGFGTSAPELLVSVFSGIAGRSNLSLGNAYGSCVFNIAGILGVAALVHPLSVKPSIVFGGVPLLTAIAVLSMFLLCDGTLSRADSFILLAAFAIVMPLYCRFDKKAETPEAPDLPGETGVLKSLFWTAVGLVAMVAASHILVWGAVDMARAFGVDELLIGLTVVAIGTSIHDLASAIAAARLRESELVLGNIVGSNIFNTLAVVGIAGAISPSPGFSVYVLSRDLPVLICVTLSLAAFGFNRSDWRKSGTAGRSAGLFWLALQILYMAVMLYQEIRR